MKKILILFSLFFLCSSVFAEEVKTYYLKPNTYYTLFCPEPVLSFNMQSNGNISYSLTSDITNSKSFVTFYSGGTGNMQTEIDTPSGKKNYIMISDGKTPENCDENFYKIDMQKDDKNQSGDKL